MKLETMKADSKEIFLDAGYMSVTVNTWANYEGASIMGAWQGAGTSSADGWRFPVGRTGCDSGGIGRDPCGIMPELTRAAKRRSGSMRQLGAGGER